MVKRLLLLIGIVAWSASADAQGLKGETLTVTALPTSAGTSCVAVNANGVFSKIGAGCGTGDITGVSFTLPSIFNAVSACTTGDCAFTFTLATQAANLVFAGPTSGVAAAPTFRALVRADIPSELAYEDESNTFTVAQQLNAGFTVDSTAFTVADTSGNTGIAGTLQVTGISTLTGLLNANGGIAVDTSNFTVDGTSGAVVTASDVAVNGGDITASGALNITPASGNLKLNPSGDVTFDPTGNDLLPITGYDLNIGAMTTKYLTLHAAELGVETLVAQDTLATIGGRVLITPTTQLIADTTNSQTTVDVKHNNLANGEFVWLQAAGKLESMKVVSSATGITGGYRYTVERNKDTTGGNVWYAGDAVVTLGAAAGDGLIDLYSLRGVLRDPTVCADAGCGNTYREGPTIVGRVRTATTNWNDLSERWAIGNLNGLFNIGANNTYGVGFGVPSGRHILITDASGIQFKDSTTVKGSLDGTAWTLGEVASSKPNIYITASALQLRNNTTAMIDLNGTTGTITGVNLQTAASCGTAATACVEMESGELRWYNATPTLLGTIDGTGIRLTASSVDDGESNKAYRFNTGGVDNGFGVYADNYGTGLDLFLRARDAAGGSNLYGRVILDADGAAGTYTSTVKLQPGLSPTDYDLKIETNGRLLVNSAYGGFITDTSGGNSLLVFDTSTLVVDSTNHRVGIGTASPGSGYSLDAVGAVRIQNSGSAYLDIQATANGWAFLRMGETGNLWDIAQLTTGSMLEFRYNGGDPQMVIEAGGDVGIGTTSPDQKFVVNGSVSTWLSRMSNIYNNSAVYMAHGSGYGMAVEAGTGASSSTYILSAYASGPTYGLYVRGDGYVAIGATSVNTNGILTLTGNLVTDGVYITNWDDAGAAQRTVCTGASTNGDDAWIQYYNGACSSASSIRYKTNVQDAALDWNAILDLRLVTFEYKNELGVSKFGVVAEEVAALGLNPLVIYNNEGLVDGVNYDRIALYLVPLIRQQRDEIAQLKARVAALEGR